MGGAFAFSNTGKRSIVVEFEQLERLAAASDVVIGDFSPAGLAKSELRPDSFSRLRPRQVITSVSPFGLTGPKAAWASTELIAQAASGLMFLTGEWDQPPMQLPPYQGELTAGVAAATATLLGARSFRADGELHRCDVSVVEALTVHTTGQVSDYVYRGAVARREARIKGGLRMVPASDRFVYCAPGAVSSMRMDGVATLLDEPRLAEERFQTAEGRMQNYDEFLELFVPPFRRKTAQEWFEGAEALHMTFALVQAVEDLFECPQLESRGLLRRFPIPGGGEISFPGRPYRIEPDPGISAGPFPYTPGGDTREVLAEWLN
jgi:crotonobetainyl-CoA:carnitine CoA-transferase CaiB-like acyl-CoA transferase